MHSGGVQLFAQRSQPAQSVFFLVTGLVVPCTFAKAKHSFAAIGAARRGHARGNVRRRAACWPRARARGPWRAECRAGAYVCAASPSNSSHVGSQPLAKKVASARALLAPPGTKLAHSARVRTIKHRFER